MMTVLAGFQFFCVLAFVRDYSLKRVDDEAQKEAAKMWLSERKRPVSDANRGGSDTNNERGKTETGTV